MPILTIFAKLGSQTFPETSKNRVLEGLGDVLGGFGGNLEASGAFLEAFWSSWGILGGILGGTWGILEGFWSVLGGSWGVLGRPWRLPGTILEVFSKDFLLLKQYMKIAKNIGKPMVFH